MRSPAPWPYLVLALAVGAAGFALGRASAPAGEHADEERARTGSPEREGPMLQGVPGRRPPGRSSGPAPSPGTASAARTAPGPDDADAPRAPAALPSGARIFDSREFVRQDVSPLLTPTGPAPEPTPEPSRVLDVRQALASDPERATGLLEDLLASADPAERAAAYQLLSAARHPLHRPLVARALEERRPEDDVRGLLNALASFKGPAWATVQLTGAPDTPLDGDLPTAWASKSPDMGEVWIELDYASAVLVDAVRVHETLGPGCVARILLAQGEAPDGEAQRWVEAWSGTATAGSSPCWFEPPLDRAIHTRHVRLIVDTSRAPGWNEIDTVELVGSGSRQWALAARAGSSYAD